MAIKTQAQILAESNSTYVDNSAGAITPNAVRALNTNWIDSILFADTTGSLVVFGATSASFATSASRAISAVSAATASFTVSSSFAVSSSRATSAESAISASFAQSSSLGVRNLTTASATANIITFTKGDGTTFTVTVAQSGSVASASYADTANVANFATSASYAFTASSAITAATAINANTASFTPNAFVSASNPTGNNSEIAFYTDGNPLTSNVVTINNVQSASFADNATSASFAVTASYALNVPNTASFAISASRAISAATATSASFATNSNNALTASFVAGVPTLIGNNTFSGTNAFNNAVTMSNVIVTGTASIAFLDVTFQSSSIIYSSGSNQFGDAANDTQTLFGTVNIATGPLVVTGSANFRNVITGSITSASFATSASAAINAATASFLLGTVASASFANTSISASFATSASRAISAATAFSATTASYATFSDSGSSTLVDNYNGINTTYYLTMVDNAAGYKRLGLDTDLSYNPSTNVLSATAQSAASASSIAIDNYNGSNTTYYLTMVDNAAGFKRVGLDTDLAYNPSTNLLTGLITSASFATSASRAISAASATSATTAATASSVTSLNQTVTITGSVNVSGSITISQGDDLITHHVQAAAVNGVEIQNNTGNVVGLFGAGGGLGSTFYGQVNATAFSGSGAQVFGVVSSSYALTASYALNGGSGAAFPFTGSAGISGSLNVVGALNVPSGSIQVTGSSTVYSGSFAIYSYKDTVAANKSFDVAVTQSLDSTNNIISIVATSGNTGSVIISGSGNYVSLSQLQGNVGTRNGTTQGFNGTNAYVTVMPSITGSNPNFNTVADRNSRRVPTITNSNVNASVTIQDNRASESSVPVTISNSSINMTPTIRIDSGSLTISNSQLLGLATFTVSGSGTAAANATMTSNVLALAGASEINFNATSSGATAVNSSILAGNVIRVRTSGSSSQNSTTTTTPALIDSILVGRNLIVTGSTASTTGTANMAVFGGFNTADGLLNDGRFTRFAIGTGTAEGTRRTSFHVSASGMTTVNEGLNVRGTESGTTELEVRTTGVKIGNLLTDSHNLTGSFAITGSQTITGSLIGQPVSQSVSSNTASLDLRLGNFFNLTLPASTNTYVTASGQVPGQTINLKITQGATTGSVTFGSGIKQVSGSAYSVTATANAVDIVTFISFDETGLYMSNVKNLI